MKVVYRTNNQTEISKPVERGERKLEIDFNPEGLLKDLPKAYLIPEEIFQERIKNSVARFFLNVDFDKEPAEWRVDIGEQPL